MPESKLTPEEYHKLSSRDRARLGNITLKIDPLKLTTENLAKLDIKTRNLYEDLSNMAIIFPKVEKTPCGIATSITKTARKIYYLAVRAAQYDPYCNREATLRKIVAKLMVLEEDIMIAGRTKFIVDSVQLSYIRRMEEARNMALALALSCQHLRQTKSTKASEAGNAKAAREAPAKN